MYNPIVIQHCSWGRKSLTPQILSFTITVIGEHFSVFLHKMATPPHSLVRSDVGPRRSSATAVELNSGCSWSREDNYNNSIPYLISSGVDVIVLQKHWLWPYEPLQFQVAMVIFCWTCELGIGTGDICFLKEALQKLFLQIRTECELQDDLMAS